MKFSPNALKDITCETPQIYVTRNRMTGQIQLNVTDILECNGNSLITAVLILILPFD